MSTTSRLPTEFTPSAMLRKALGRALEEARSRQWRGSVHYLAAGLGNVINAASARWRPHRFHCPCCGSDVPAFVNEANRVRVARASTCPSCGSRSRHRGLVLLFEDLARLGTAQRILHFAPEEMVADGLLAAFDDAAYESTDRYMPGVSHPGEDIQSLTLRGEQYDLIVCNHVLEHVPDDEAAMRELNRLLRPGGLAVITLPGDWYRAETVVFDDLSHNGHHRDYGWSVLGRLREHFDRVEALDLSTLRCGEAGKRNGVRVRDIAFCCSRDERSSPQVANSSITLSR